MAADDRAALVLGRGRGGGTSYTGFSSWSLHVNVSAPPPLYYYHYYYNYVSFVIVPSPPAPHSPSPLSLVLVTNCLLLDRCFCLFLVRENESKLSRRYFFTDREKTLKKRLTWVKEVSLWKWILGVFVTFLSPPRQVFLYLFLLYDRYLLCTTLCIWTVFRQSAVLFVKREKKTIKACFLTDKIFCNTSILKYIRRETAIF